MARKTKKSPKATDPVEKDSTYFLKIVLYVILGSFWLKFDPPMQVGEFVFYGVPLGLVIGVIFASHDHFAVDRRIEYAILLLITIFTFYIPAGIVL